MKRLLGPASILLCVAFAVAVMSTFARAQTAALATADTKPIVHPALSVRQALEIAGALAQMNCEPKLITDGAKQSVQCVPYGTDRLKVGFAWQIAQNQARIKAVVETYQKERNRMLAAAERKPDGNLTEKASAQFLLDDAELLDASSGITVDRFKKDEVEKLGLQPGILAALLPIIDEK